MTWWRQTLFMLSSDQNFSWFVSTFVSAVFYWAIKVPIDPNNYRYTSALRTCTLSYFKSSNLLTDINQTFSVVHRVLKKININAAWEIFLPFIFLSKVISLSLIYTVYGYRSETMKNITMLMIFIIRKISKFQDGTPGQYGEHHTSISPWYELRKRKQNHFSAVEKDSKWPRLGFSCM